MSVFRSETVACPLCGSEIDVDLVVSVNADRRPDLRAAILDNSFQRQACPSCGANFRIDPEFTYMDMGRGQYIGVWPLAERARWRACAEQTQQAFDAALGAEASPEARRLGERMQPRVVFGWPALIEKILARGAGIDDATLEVAKIAAMSSGGESPLPGERELRLVGVDDQTLTLGWVSSAEGRLGEALAVPRQLITDIEAEPAAWQELRADVAEGLMVDFQREMLADDE
ncbi:MAG: CpXC domain-containing protein [Piscinibacter sp.]|nr:CpXC domain-containing protein [Piscinibacter sp.]